MPRHCTLSRSPEEHKKLYVQYLDNQISKEEHDWNIVQAWKSVWPEMFKLPKFNCKGTKVVKESNRHVPLIKKDQ